MPFSKEDVTALAFKIYKENKSMDESIWQLSELCVTINRNIIDGYDIKPLETDNLLLLIRPDVNGQIIRPEEDEIRDVAEIIYHENPDRDSRGTLRAARKQQPHRARDRGRAQAQP